MLGDRAPDKDRGGPGLCCPEPRVLQPLWLILLPLCAPSQPWILACVRPHQPGFRSWEVPVGRSEPGASPGRAGEEGPAGGPRGTGSTADPAMGSYSLIAGELGRTSSNGLLAHYCFLTQGSVLEQG